MEYPQKPSSFDDVHKTFQDIHDNLGLDDLKPSGIRTEAPSADNLAKGRILIVELSGVPYIYYRTLAGNIYRLTMTAV